MLFRSAPRLPDARGRAMSAPSTRALGHEWRKGVGQFSTSIDDAYEFACRRCGDTAWLETGRRGSPRRDLPSTRCPGLTEETMTTRSESTSTRLTH